MVFPPDFEQMLDLLDAEIPDGSSLVGWSLGGLLAQGLVLHKPEKYSRLVLIASNAQFQQSAQWPCAMKAEVVILCTTTSPEVILSKTCTKIIDRPCNSF